MGTETVRLAGGDLDKGTECIPVYVVITPARNEVTFIEQAIKSMAAQTVPPIKWVIVSDGSTDGTDDIVKKYTCKYSWMELVRMPERAERNFASKVHAFNAGYEHVKNLEYDVIGNLDADVTFDEEYFDFILARFIENPLLGVAGTAYIENSSGTTYNYDIVNIEDVSGACQMFRRECFEDIGGYIPIKGGGIDLTAVYTARMKGWKTRTFTEKTFVHHRRRGTGQSKLLASFFRFGKQDYYLGGHPLWEIIRSVYHMKHKPYVLAGFLLFSGYLWAFLKRTKRPISDELIAFRRKEQMQRLMVILRRFLTPRSLRTSPERAVVAADKKP